MASMASPKKALRHQRHVAGIAPLVPLPQLLGHLGRERQAGLALDKGPLLGTEQLEELSGQRLQPLSQRATMASHAQPWQAPHEQAGDRPQGLLEGLARHPDPSQKGYGDSVRADCAL